MNTYKITRNSQATGYRLPAPGFTLVELLVVIAILVLLAGILLPAMSMARQNIKAKITESNIILIATACDMYATDYEAISNATLDNYYPPSVDTTAGGDFYFDSSDNPTGAEFLALLLTGYAPDDGTAGEPYNENGDGTAGDPMFDDDGRSGFGFRTVRRGKIYGPYNGTEKLDTTYIDKNGNKEKDPSEHTVFADAFGNPILYYQRDNLSDTFTAGDNPGPPANGDSYTEKKYWTDADEGMNATDRLILILSPGPDGGWENDDDEYVPAMTEDDIMND